MIRSHNSASARLALLAAVGVGLLFVGACDSGGSKRDSLYQQLVGTWRIDRVDLDQGTITYDDTVRVTFVQRNDARAYRIVRTASNDTTATGQLDIPRSNLLRMTSGFSGPLVWNFEFDGSISVQFRLRQADDESVQEFLAAIGLSGGAQRLTLDLLRDSE